MRSGTPFAGDRTGNSHAERESKASSKATAEALGGAYLVYGNERYDEWVSVEME